MVLMISNRYLAERKGPGCVRLAHNIGYYYIDGTYVTKASLLLTSVEKWLFRVFIVDGWGFAYHFYKFYMYFLPEPPPKEF